MPVPHSRSIVLLCTAYCWSEARPGDVPPHTHPLLDSEGGPNQVGSSPEEATDRARPGQPRLPDTSLRVACNGTRSDCLFAKRGSARPWPSESLWVFQIVQKKGITYRPQLGARKGRDGEQPGAGENGAEQERGGNRISVNAGCGGARSFRLSSAVRWHRFLISARQVAICHLVALLLVVFEEGKIRRGRPGEAQLSFTGMSLPGALSVRLDLLA
jgi:hypothetical protein